MNTDDVLSISNTTSIISTRCKVHTEYIVLASKTYKYDQFGGRSLPYIQAELSSKKNKFQGFIEIE